MTLGTMEILWSFPALARTHWARTDVLADPNTLHCGALSLGKCGYFLTRDAWVPIGRQPVAFLRPSHHVP
jgi:hypothetical protein